MGSPPLPESLRHRGFRTFLTARGASELGSEMLPVALVGLVLAEHGPLVLGLVLGARGVAGTLFVLFSGALLGRVRRSTALAANDLVQLAVMLGFAFGPGDTAWFLCLAALSGVAGSVGEPAAGSVMPLLVPGHRLQEANALRSIVGRTMGVTGPAVAGVLVALLEARTVPLLIAGAFAVGAAVMLCVREAPPPAESSTTMGANLRAGLREVVRRPWVLAIIAVATVQAPATLAPGFTLLPIVVADAYAAPVYGLALSCMSAGQLLGGVVAARWSPRHPGLVSLAGVLVYPLVLLGLAATVPAWLLLTGYAATGVGFMLFGVYWYTALQWAVPQDLLGVVIGADQVGSFGLEPVGYAVSGALAEAVGPRPVLVGAAVVGLVTTLAPLAVPGVSRLADSPGDDGNGR
nr:MFS transporter [Nocardiopsis halotolerans]